jgi:phenylacetate-CoA ligase
MAYCPQEKLSQWEMKKLQSERLTTLLKRVQDTPFYKGKFEPSAIQTIDDISKLPFTKKQDLRDHYPFGLLRVPMDKIVRIHSSSGTTGKPTVVAYSEQDMQIWQEVIARAYTMGNLQKGDILHNATGYGLFTGGLGFHDGARHLGIATVPSSTGFTSRQLLLLRDFGATAITGTPPSRKSTKRGV